MFNGWDKKMESSKTLSTMTSTSTIPGSLRNLFLAIMTFAMTSIVINYKSVPYNETNGSDFMTLDQRDIVIAESVDIRGFGRSLNQHSDPFTRSVDGDIKQQLVLKLTQIEQKLQQNAKSPAIAFGDSKTYLDNLASVILKGRRLHLIQTNGEYNKLGEIKWSIMFCSNNRTCPTYITNMDQKVDVIPSISNYVDNPTALCTLARALHRNNGDAEPCCIKNTAINVNKDAQTGPSNGNKLINYTQCSNLSDSTNVTWNLPNNPIMFEAGPVLRLYTLVTSLFPLRFYISQHTYSGQFNAFGDDINFLKSSVGETLQHISETYGLQTSILWWDTLRTTILKYFLHIESTIDKQETRCKRCFQVLKLDVTCLSLSQCDIIKLSKRDDLTTDYINSVWSITDVRYNVTGFVSKALGSILAYLPIELCSDDVYTDGCLSSEDLVYILDDRREMVNSSEWIKVYPSTEGLIMTPTLHEKSSMADRGKNRYHMNDVLMELQKHYTFTHRGDQYFLNRELLGNGVNIDFKDTIRFSECSYDDHAYGKLGIFRTNPSLSFEQLTPGEYHTNVSYDTISIRLWAEAKHCHCELRIESKYNRPGPRNITLGLGETVVRIYTADIRIRELTIVGVTILTIYRKPKDLNPNVEMLKACGFRQDCSFRFLVKERCDVYDLGMTWPMYKSMVWPRCDDGSTPGEWVVPCKSCTDSDSCDWKISQWQPYRCSYHDVTTHSLKRCMDGRKLLFIGDSTNRGIMNYMIEKINGSLWDWDKTHSLKVYTDVNRNATSFSFAYYPHFWLPVDHRPTFHKLIYQLIKSAMPLDNNINTVLVVGGVQWLAEQHIDYIIQALQKKGLNNITKVVKGIGAGFHQIVEGVRFVSPIEQSRLAQREVDILTYAKARGFKIVSTFNMTMARYKDFLEGKCACHFHKVKNKQVVGSVIPTRQFSVEGKINAAYSDIIIDQICN